MMRMGYTRCFGINRDIRGTLYVGGFIECEQIILVARVMNC